MNLRRFYPALIVPLLLAAGCAKSVPTLLADGETRQKAIETLVTDASMRGEVIARLLKTPAERDALFAGMQQDEKVAGAFIHKTMQSDRGKALMASEVASDQETAKTFLRMLMLTGVVGELMTQQQADRLDLGEAFARGNQTRTMADLKRLGGVVDGWAHGHEGFFPVCNDYEDVNSCLAKRLPDGALAKLRLKDAWGNPFLYHSDPEGTDYALISYATDGQYDRLGRAGPTDSYDCDIVFSNGDFVQWPGRIRKESIQ